MAQVLTSENMVEFIQTRQVPEFKAPEAKAEAAKPSEPAAAEAAKPDPQQAKTAEQPRGEDGKFVKAEAKAESEKVDDTAAKAADDEEDADLPERVRRQIGRKHRQMKEAEEFARSEYAERKAAEERAAALQRELEELKSKSGPKPEKGADAPKPEDFKTVAEYADALTDYLLEKKLAAREAKRSEEQTKTAQQREIEKTQADLAERVEKLKKDIPDFEDVVESIPDEFSMPPVMARYFVQNPVMLYHLQKSDPKELQRLVKLPPIDAIERLGELKAQYVTKKEPAAAPVARVSKAPAPITPLDGSSTTVPKDPSQMTFQELRAHREAERRAGKYR